MIEPPIYRQSTRRRRVLTSAFAWVVLGTLGALPLQCANTADAPPSAGNTQAAAAQQQPAVPRLDIYGFVMADNGFNFGTIDQAWFDVVRPTKLPSFPGEFGRNGRWFSSVRQSRLGFKGHIPTTAGVVNTIFEFELFGVGVDAGQTTFRLRHAWGELGQIGAGQTWSPFMDPDVFPNSLEYWGPNGMVFFRNVQVRWTPWSRDGSNFMLALERPGATAETNGPFADRIEIENILPRFPWPDLSGHLRLARDWGHIQIAGIVRSMRWDDVLTTDAFNLDGSEVGWGFNVSSNVHIVKDKDILRLQAVYGEGIENYMNDAPVDVGIVPNPGNPITPITGEALPVLGIVAFLDHTWSEKFTSTIGYSLVDIDNSEGQTPNAFKRGHYALTNLLYYPVKGVMMGGEFQWGRRANKSDGFTFNDYRIQFSFRYNFGFTVE